jgi:hypothetical protein
MKQIAVFIAVVLGYSLLELCVAFALTVPVVSPYLIRQPILAALLLVLIPGLAGIFSGFRYDPNQSLKRGLLTIALGLSVPAGIVFAGVSLVAVGWGLETHPNLGILLALIVTCVWLALLSFTIHRSRQKLRKWDCELEVSSWLDGKREYKLRQRAIRWALWIPSLVVLGVLLFFFESWGAASHIAVRCSGQLREYGFSIPMKWMVVEHVDYPQVGASRSTGITGTNVGRAPRAYFGGGAPLSSWTIETDECSLRLVRHRFSESVHAHQTTRTIGAGATKFACSEARLSEVNWPPVDPDVYVRCSGPERLTASFYGRKTELPLFYDVLRAVEYSGDSPPCPLNWQEGLRRAQSQSKNPLVNPKIVP